MYQKKWYSYIFFYTISNPQDTTNCVKFYVSPYSRTQKLWNFCSFFSDTYVAVLADKSSHRLTFVYKSYDYNVRRSETKRYEYMNILIISHANIGFEMPFCSKGLFWSKHCLENMNGDLLGHAQFFTKLPMRYSGCASRQLLCNIVSTG